MAEGLSVALPLSVSKADGAYSLNKDIAALKLNASCCKKAVDDIKDVRSFIIPAERGSLLVSLAASGASKLCRFSTSIVLCNLP